MAPFWMGVPGFIGESVYWLNLELTARFHLGLVGLALLPGYRAWFHGFQLVQNSVHSRVSLVLCGTRVSADALVYVKCP
jgi:hypothetical protein